MNPPFGKELPDWVDKFISHGNGIALVADRTYSRWWQKLVKGSERVLFVSPRIQFISPGRKVANSSIGSTLVSIGVKGNLALQTAAANGLGVFAATTCYQSVFLRNADPLLDK